MWTGVLEVGMYSSVVGLELAYYRFSTLARLLVTPE